ncbi:hypothetical protein [Longimycelium tulufanense]|uniref:hypothetical protein n=1 Tax=Longimycelium tulufanense TaxID=907463 RepID=UPI001666C41B|nr:hypothetical protein [Longimycelium tulufanense]
MSLLDRGQETVTVYQEIVVTDEDGNIRTMPGTEGVTTVASVQLRAQSGTSARRNEQDNEGFETESVYRLRLPRSFPFVLGAQARVKWRGVFWSVIGDAQVFTGSPRTAHVEYTIRRT